jgi:tetratricopeptide (TPR) repeat protein
MVTVADEDKRSSQPAAPTLVGRHAETEQLTTLLSQAEAGFGTTALVTGPGGIGKTSILRWLEEAARSRKHWVSWGYCLPGIQDPFFAMEQVFRSGKGEPRMETDYKDHSGSRGLPIAFVPKTAGAANLSGLPAAFIPFVREPAVESSSAKRAPANVLIDYLNRIEKEAVAHPCILLIDDFQWADHDSVEALRFLSRNIKHMPVLIAVALREDEVKSTPLHDVLRDMRREGLTADIPLAGLEEKDIRNLLQNTVKVPLDDLRAAAAVRFLREMTGGNPYFFLEVVRLWREIGLIHVERGRAVIDVPHGASSGKDRVVIPQSVSNLLTGRMSLLNGEETELLEAAAMIGQEFEVAPLEELFSSHGESVRSSLRKLTAEKWLAIPSRGEGHRYAFAHALLWETVRQSTPEEKLKMWAGKLASWWAEHLPADLDQIAALYELGGLNAKALECIGKAIDLSLQMHAHERVERYFEKGFTLLAREGTPVQSLAEWGIPIVDRLKGDGGSAKWVEPMVRMLLKKDPPEPISWELSIRLADAMQRNKETRQLIDKLYDAARQKPELASPALLGRLAIINSVLLYSEGKHDASAEFAKEALSRLPENDKFGRGFAYFRLGWTDIGGNRLEDATSDLEKGMTVAKEGRIWGLLPLLLNLKGTITVMKGDLKATEECMSDAVATYKNLGQASALSITLSNLSNTRLEMGNLDGAEEAARDALHVAEAFDLLMAQGVAACALGRVLEHKKVPSEAVKLFERARGIFGEIGSADMLLQMDFDMAEVKGLLGDPAGALADLAKVKEGDALIQDQLPYLHLLRARFAAATGDKDGAKVEVERALAESRRTGLRYWEGRSLLALSDWEKVYESPENATRRREEAEAILKDCGVVSLEPFA